MTTRHSYTARKKLEIVQYAEQHGNRAAGRKYPGINESSIRNWRKTKERLQQLDGSKRAERGCPPPHPELEQELIRWMADENGQGQSVTAADVMLKARVLIEKTPNCGSFKASRSWVTRFLKRHNLSLLHGKRGVKTLPVDEPRTSLTDDDPDHRQLRCKYCEAEFLELALLRKHIETHSTKSLLMCEFCGKSFSEKSTLKTHTLIHSGEKPHRCTLCGKRFKHLSSLTTHIGTHSKRYKCPFCAKGFSDPYLRKRHMKVHLKDEQLHPQLSHDIISSNGGHSYNLNEKLFRCDTCKKSFTTTNMLIKHMGQHSENLSNSASDQELLTEGMQTNVSQTAMQATHNSAVTDLLNFALNLEQVDPAQDESLGRMLAGIPPKKNQVLEDCDFDGKQNSCCDPVNSVKGLLPDQQQQAAFTCEVCGMSFNMLDNFTEHIRTMHEGEKATRKYKCSLCEREFTNYESFETHLRTYISQRVHFCKFCSKSFNRSKLLELHSCMAKKKKKTEVREKAEMTKKSYKCKRCSKSFKLMIALKKHKCLPVKLEVLAEVNKCSEESSEIPNEQQRNLRHHKISGPMQNPDLILELPSEEHPERTECVPESSPIPVSSGNDLNYESGLKESHSLRKSSSKEMPPNELSEEPHELTLINIELNQKSTQQTPQNPSIKQNLSETDEPNIKPEFERPGNTDFSQEASLPISCNLISSEHRLFDPFTYFGSLETCTTSKALEMESSALGNLSFGKLQDNLKSLFTNLKQRQELTQAITQSDCCDRLNRNTNQRLSGRKDSKEQPYKCEKCQRLFQLKIALRKHKCLLEPDIPAFPQKTFNSTRLKERRRTETEKRLCYGCVPSSSSPKEDDKKHSLTKDHPNFVCASCEKSFTSASGLNRHAKVHSRRIDNTLAAQYPVKISCSNRRFKQNKTKPQEIRNYFFTTPLVSSVTISKSNSSSSATARLQSPSVVYERNRLTKDIASEEISSLSSANVSYSYNERPFACGLCTELFSTRDETLGHFFKCISQIHCKANTKRENCF